MTTKAIANRASRRNKAVSPRSTQMRIEVTRGFPPSFRFTSALSAIGPNQSIENFKAEPPKPLPICFFPDSSDQKDFGLPFHPNALHSIHRPFPLKPLQRSRRAPVKLPDFLIPPPVCRQIRP